MIDFDSFKTEYKSPQGAARAGTPVRFCVRTDAEAEHINLVFRGEDEITVFLLKKTGENEFRGEAELKEPGFYRYRFELVRADGIMSFAGTVDGHTAVIGDWLPEWRLFVYDGDFETPEVGAGAVMYQIFPDRFFSAGTKRESKSPRIMHESWDEKPYCKYDYDDYRGNDFFGGDLAGITEKLDRLAELSVTHLYLNPIFESAENHRYSTSDYMHVDPYLGTDGDFERLCAEAKKRGITVILDGVFSHTGADSVYFNKFGRYGDGGAYNDERSPYRKWYNFGDYPNGYASWWGFEMLPNVNETEESYLEFITGEDGVLRHWMRLGAGGWRLDVADELPDRFIEAVRKAVKAQDPQAPIIGEVWENAVTKVSYGRRREFLRGKQCDSVMNYPFLNAVTAFFKDGDAGAFERTVREILDDYPAPAVKWLMNSLSTHDTARVINRLALDKMPPRETQSSAELTDGQYARGRYLFMSAAILQFTLPGIPCVYYGDEAGLCGFEDPFCRGTYPWGREDEELFALHAALGRMRRENAAELERELKFESVRDGVLRYSRGALMIIANMSGGDVAISEPLIANGYENGALKSGGAAIVKG